MMAGDVYCTYHFDLKYNILLLDFCLRLTFSLWVHVLSFYSTMKVIKTIIPRGQNNSGIIARKEKAYAFAFLFT
jgi:hypothetical protein